MCDIWKANNNKQELTYEELQKHVEPFVALGVREIIFSGGEALMHSNLWQLCALFKAHNIRLTLLSTGLLLEKNAADIVAHIDEVIVSIDGSEAVHDKIRNIPQGYQKLSKGIAALRRHRSTYRITGRCVLQRHNYFDFINIVRAAKEIGLDQISFLAADVSTPAFNRTDGWNDQQINQVALAPEDIETFEKILNESFDILDNEYENKFIAESKEKIGRVARHYKTLHTGEEMIAPPCNAPWVSAVIETDGSVMPCFFHKPYGNIFENSFESILNSPSAIHFRKTLNVQTNSTCKRCVCSLKLGVTKLN